MKESILQRKIRKSLVDEFGGYWYKVHGGQFQNSGLPDIVGCLQGQFYGIEVKQPGKVATLLQQVTLNALKDQGAITGVVHSISEAISLVATTRSLQSRVD